MKTPLLVVVYKLGIFYLFIKSNPKEKIFYKNKKKGHRSERVAPTKPPTVLRGNKRTI